MREIAIQRYCDGCWDSGQGTRVLATQSWMLALRDGDTRTGPPKLVEVCDDHGKLLTAAAWLHSAAPDLSAVTAPPEPARKKGPGRPRLNNAEHPVVVCPVCDQEKSRGSIRLHIYRVHRGETPPTSTSWVCPVCERPFTTPQGYAQHTYRAHNLDPLWEALAGVPGWNAMLAQRWARDPAFRPS
jgi:hypothetical protein